LYGGGDLDLNTLNVQPAGGVFTGENVTGSLFDPVAAGLGESLITYSYDYGGGCSGSCTFTITVLPNLVEVSAGMYPNTVE
jgi:hypothetical protein